MRRAQMEPFLFNLWVLMIHLTKSIFYTEAQIATHSLVLLATGLSERCHLASAFFQLENPVGATVLAKETHSHGNGASGVALGMYGHLSGQGVALLSRGDASRGYGTSL